MNVKLIHITPEAEKLFPRENLNGKVFDRLTVLNFYNYVEMSNRRQPYWICVCICGSFKLVRQNCLKNNKVRSCGCLLREVYFNLKEKTKKINTKEPGIAAFNGLINSYKQRAKRLKIKFELTNFEFKQLINKNCTYCGIIPLQLFPSDNRMQKRKTNGSILYNGIDRIDSNLGYILKNSVPACKMCNLAKSNYSQKEFLNWIKRLRDFSNESN